MSKINIKKFSNDTIKINNINTISARLQSKIKLFFKNNQNDRVTILGEEDILLKYPSLDFNLVGKDLEEILYFLDVNKIDYFLDEMVFKIIESYNKQSEENIIKKEYLYNMKKADFTNTPNFKKFKDFCDKNIRLNLRDYQYKASYLLVEAKSGFDFSVPGSGKTIISYTAYRYFKEFDNIEKIFIIGPKSAYNAWYDEFINCFGKEPNFKNLSNEKIDDSKHYLTSSKKYHSEVTFINIDKIRYLKKHIISFLRTNNCLLIIDEAHKVKNPSAQVTKIVLEVSKCTDFKILLTGTPMPNGYEDLYTLTKILLPNQNVLPFNYSQLKNFTQRGISEKNETKIMQSIFPYFSRVSKKYLLDRGELLPSETNFSAVKMSQEQQEIYDFLNELAIDYSNNWETEFAFILLKAIMIRKMQVSANPKLLNTSISSVYNEFRKEMLDLGDNYDLISEEYKKQEELLKIAELQIKNDIAKSKVASIIKDYTNGKLQPLKNDKAVFQINKILQKGKKVIVWEVFVDNMYSLQDLILEKINVKSEIINGRVTGEERQKIINNFREGNLKVLIASPATLAESISLHRACQSAIYVNRNYNAAQFIQSKDRIHRINMPEGTTANYYFILNSNTIDESINERLELKEQRMLRILDSEKLEVGELETLGNMDMSIDDIKSAFELEGIDLNYKIF